MVYKPKIIQILNQDKTLIGLGDDGKIYNFNYQTHEWVGMEVEVSDGKSKK